MNRTRVGILTIVVSASIGILLTSPFVRTSVRQISPFVRTSVRQISQAQVSPLSSPPESAPAQVLHAPSNEASLPDAVGKPSSVRQIGPLVRRQVAANFIDGLVRPDGKTAEFALADGRVAKGAVEMSRRDSVGMLWVRGTLTEPEAGSFYFQRQTVEGKAGWLVGYALLPSSGIAVKLVPGGPAHGAVMEQTIIDKVVCAAINDPSPPEQHPTNVPVPSYQTVTPLNSLPGAVAVIYLDWDGEAGPFGMWGNFDAAPSGTSNTDIFAVWKLVAEDYLPLNINVTTDRQVYDRAPEGSRIHCIITPTTIVAPGVGAGGGSVVGSFSWTGDPICWAYILSGKNSAEVISHEVGHTLGLLHHGILPAQEYNNGWGTGVTSWAPIMGTAYGKNLSQWCAGDYANASNPGQADITAMCTLNNNVAVRTDDGGDTAATARDLEILADDSVSNRGIIETSTDVDAFHFSTSGGTIAINVNTVADAPNIDLLAELVDVSTGNVVLSDNPDLALNATLSATLAAGDYLVKVSGVGRTDPATGYSNYGSLGSYYITGTVAGSASTPRFVVAEHSPNGTAVGTVTPTTTHGGNQPSYSITAGNSFGAFAINPATGALTVADSASVDFEALSVRWQDAAACDLTVEIAWSNPDWNETQRVVVTVTNVNEAPVLAPSALTILEHTKANTKLLNVNCDDPDHFDIATLSITGGNAGNAFGVDQLSGCLTIAADISVSVPTIYTLTLTGTDTGTPALSASTTVTITVLPTAADYEPGRIVRTFFDGISGTAVTDLTSSPSFPDAPSSETFLTSLDATTYRTNFGDTLRAFVIPPVSGDYTFWLSSSDASELWLGTGPEQASASIVATVTDGTGRYQWDTSPGQQSLTVTLAAGQPYWVEVRHKQGAAANDHVEVAWQGPGIARSVVSGLYLSPVYQNYAPTVQEATFQVRQDSVLGHAVGTVVTTDINQQDTFGGYAIINGNTGGVFGIDAATGKLFVATPGLLNSLTTPTYALTISSTDNGTPAMSDDAVITVNVLAATGVNVAGVIQQRWSGSFFTIADVLANPAYPYSPTTTRTFAAIDTPNITGENIFGSRLQALVTPAVSGTYNFYMSADDQAELWYSADPTGAGATKIVSFGNLVTTYNNFSAAIQKSVNLTLTAGQPYYLQVLHKQGGNYNFVQVAWTGPGIATPTIIPSSALKAYDLNKVPTFASSSYAWTVAEGTATNTVVGSVSGTDLEGEALTYALITGNSADAFKIDPATGAVSVANSAPLASGTVFNLQVAAQDHGINLMYPLRSAVAALTITIPLPNLPPTGPATLTKASATRGLPYSATLAGDFTDPNPGDVLTFTKQSGPAWLIVSTSGALSGTPGVGDVGENSWSVSVTDSSGLFTTTTLNIDVTSVNNSPVWTSHSFAKPTGIVDIAYLSTLVGEATDPDVGDTLTYSKVTGPAWLTVASNGALSGTPALTDVGVNSWSVRVTDAGGLFDTATMQITISAPPLGAPWTSADIGAVGRVGATVTGSGVYNQAGAGVGVSGTADAFQFASQSLTGAGEIRARLTSLGGTAAASGGLMIREGTAASAKVALLSVKSGNFTFSSRSTTGGTATVATVAAANAAPNNWLRLTRSGGVITAYRSSDGLIWINSGSVTFSGATTLLVGVATASGDTSNLATATFDSLQITPFPSQWLTQQIGTVTAAGRAEYFANAYALSGAGIFGGTSDSFLFTQQTMSSDGQLIARITSMQNTGTSARAGIMIRDTTATGAKYAFFGISSDGTYRFQYRTKTGASTTVTGGIGTFPNVWVKLTRVGSTISAYKSADGINWTLVGSKAVTMGANAPAGFSVGSGSTTTLGTSTFDNLSFTP